MYANKVEAPQLTVDINTDLHAAFLIRPLALVPGLRDNSGISNREACSRAANSLS